MRNLSNILFAMGLFWACFCENGLADDLPPGVPRTVDSRGSVLFIEPSFTSRLYQEQSKRLILKEANDVARDLNLDENLPIVDTNLVHAFVSPFGFAYQSGAVGNITTSNYWYGVERNFRFSQLTGVRSTYQRLVTSPQARRRIDTIDTNEIIRLADKWLTSVAIDVSSLDRDCNLTVALDNSWNGNMGSANSTNAYIIPVYNVYWMLKDKSSHHLGSVVYLNMYVPAKMLLMLRITDSKFSRRAPVKFESLGLMFPGNARIITNSTYQPEIPLAPRPSN